jgi:hypothetical protein
MLWEVVAVTVATAALDGVFKLQGIKIALVLGFVKFFADFSGKTDVVVLEVRMVSLLLC